MATSYSTNLALALPATGELSGTWGTTVNTNITNMLDEALGYQAYSATGGADTITIPDGTTGVARSIYIQLNGTGGGSVAVPATKTKMYFVFNNTASAITFKVTGQTGVSIPAAAKMALVSNGTDVIVAQNYFAALTLGAALPVLSGGTGVTTSTGTGSVVLNTSPTLVTPALGTPSSGTVTNLTGTASININGTVGATTANTGAFTTLSATSFTNSGLTSGRVVYTTTGGLETSSANLLYAGADLTVYGLTVGRGAGAVASNTAVGASALAANVTASNSTAVGYQAGNLVTGAGNQFFGNSSGSAVTTGAKNVILGSYTGSAAPISATGSNFVVLSDGDGNVRQYFNGANATFNGSISAAGDLSLTGTNRVITLPGDASTSSGSIKFTTPIYGADTGASYGSNGNTARILFTSSLGFYGGATLSAATQVMDLSSSGNLGIGTTANASAILDAQSTTKGVRMPNMTTTQKNAISSPAAGLMVFDTTLAKLCVYSGSAWQTITSV